MRALITLILSFFLTFNTCYAQVVSSVFGQRGGSEFWVGKDEGKPLITVNLIGGVASPGVYHIPIDTTLAQLIAYAGGPARNAKTDEISIRRQKTKDQIEILQIDFDKVSRFAGPVPTLNDKDIVDIPISYALERSSQILSIVSAALAIILTANALSDDK